MKTRKPFNSRNAKIQNNNMGIIAGGDKLSGTYRKASLYKVDQYLSNTQYDSLSDWDATNACGNPLKLSQRKPKIIYNLGKRIADTLASKLMGPRVFPTISLDEDPVTKELFDHVVKISGLKAKSLDMARYLASHGSCFLRFKFVNGVLKTERYNPNICYPTFDQAGELETLDIKYVYNDLKDLDEKGNPKKKWYKLSLSKFSDTLFDNPEFGENGEDPVFQPVKTNKHELGYVQGEWFRIGDDPNDPDGPSLVGEVLGFIDAFNYSLSQSDRAVSYNQEPQLILKGMDTQEIDDLVKSSLTAWNMGREGEANYLESGLTGVDKAIELRMKYREGAGDITRVILLDPEKIVGSAQSAKAMEVLHGPLLDVIDEYRPYAERGMITLVQKMVVSILRNAQLGIPMVGISIPRGYKPLSLDIKFSWPAVFPMTMQDLQQKVGVASAAAGASIISRETLTKWLAKDFGIENIEEEIAKIEAQPVINPFGF